MKTGLLKLWRSRFGVPILGIGFVCAATFILPPIGITIVGLICFLVIVGRYDNDTGTFLPLAILLIIVIGILLILMAIMTSFVR